MNRRVVATLGSLTVGGILTMIANGQGTVLVAGGMFAICVPMTSVRFVDEPKDQA